MPRKFSLCRFLITLASLLFGRPDDISKRFGMCPFFQKLHRQRKLIFCKLAIHDV